MVPGELYKVGYNSASTSRSVKRLGYVRIRFVDNSLVRAVTFKIAVVI